MQDLLLSENYIIYLIDNKGSNEFKTGLRDLIEQSLK